MRLPQTPPNSHKLISKDRLLKGFNELVSLIPELSRADKYLHWNDLRRRPTPAKLNHEEWWWILKQGRISGRRTTPLLDKNLKPFSFCQPDQLSQLLHEIDREIGSTFGLPPAVKNASNRDQYIVSSLIQESITSSQLEGAATTREVAKEMLRVRRPPRDKHERMILNNYLTMERIRELRDKPLTPNLVLELQSIVTENTLDDPSAAGRFRRENEDVKVMDMEGTVFHSPPLANQLKERMKAMCEFANGETPEEFVHPVIRAIILHFWLAYDHPFVAGNGRTARALFYWSMLRENYELFEFISISQVILRGPAKYNMAFLHTETDDNDLTYFVLHQAKVIDEAVKALRAYVEQKMQSVRLTEKIMRGVEGLNHRQQALLNHALHAPTTRYTIVGHEESHRISHQTARNDLFNLVEKGLLLLGPKRGRAYTFRSPTDLTEKLSNLADATSFEVKDNTTLELELSPQPDADR